MTRDAISDLIACGEGPTVELKRSLTKDGGRELCAFANADGGTILIGVSDAGEIVGVANHNRVKSRVQSTARSADPPIELEVESVGRVLRSSWKSRASVESCAWSYHLRSASPTPSAGASSCASGRTVSRCRTRKSKICSTRSDAAISTGSPARIFPSRTISMKRHGRGSATTPRFRKPWIGWWLSETSVYWTGRTA